jgi:hypothetical protein
MSIGAIAWMTYVSCPRTRRVHSPGHQESFVAGGFEAS